MIFTMLVMIVALAPLPLGSNRPWAWNLIALLIGLITLFFSVSLWRQKIALHIGEIKTSIVLFAIVAFWVVFQASGLPPSSLHHPLWEITAETLKQPVHSAISLDPEQSFATLMRLLTYALVFLLTFHYCRQAEKARIVFLILSWSGFAYAIYGLAVYLGDYNTILWYPKWSSAGDVSATFVNRNNYATYAGLTLLCSLALLLDQMSRVAHYDFSSYWGIQRLIELLITRGWIPLLILFTTGSALILSHSRGGFLSTLLATGALLTVLNINRQSRHIPVLSGLVCACIVAVWIFFSSGEAVFERLDQSSLDEESRDEVFRLTFIAIKDNAWFGIGYGGFEEGFRLYKDASVPPLHYVKAHNTYLENMLELGVPAAFLLFGSIANLAWICLTGVFNRRKQWIYPATGFAATVLIAAHSLVDFSLQIPAVALTYALLLGAACSQAFSSRTVIHKTVLT